MERLNAETASLLRTQPERLKPSLDSASVAAVVRVQLKSLSDQRTDDGIRNEAWLVVATPILIPILRVRAERNMHLTVVENAVSRIVDGPRRGNDEAQYIDVEINRLPAGPLSSKTA